MEQDTEQGKPIAVNVVTLLVTPDEAERLTLGATQGKIQLALRNPLDKTSPYAWHSPGGAARHRAGCPRRSTGMSLTHVRWPPWLPPRPTPEPTVEIIRGDKRADEVVR